MADNTIRIDRAFLERAALRVNQLMLEIFDNEKYTELSGYAPSERFVSAMDGIIKKTKKRRISKPIKTMIIIAAILALIGGCALGAAAIRRARLIYDFTDRSSFAVVDWYHEISGNGVAVDELYEIKTRYEPSYIPKGFVVINRDLSISGCMVEYEKSCGQSKEYCVFLQDVAYGIGTVDTEDDTVYKFKIKGFPAFCVVDHINESVRLFWCDDYYVYSIIYQSPNATMEEVVKMAESLTVAN